MTISESQADSAENTTQLNNNVQVKEENGSLFQNKNRIYASNNKSVGSDKVVKNIKSGKESNDEDTRITRKQHMSNTLDVDEARDAKEGFSLGNFSPSPMLLIPQLILLGFSPVILANLKVMVMNALMLNNMALSSALFMTLRNMVFGPTGGSKVKYPNYGYQNHHSRNGQRRRYYDIR